MLTKNIDPARKLVNGARGKVIDFRPKDLSRRPDVSRAPLAPLNDEDGGGGGRPGRLYPVVEFVVEPGRWERIMCTPEEWAIEESGREVAKRVQVPLKLAWAISSAPPQTPSRRHLTTPRSPRSGRRRTAPACPSSPRLPRAHSQSTSRRG